MKILNELASVTWRMYFRNHSIKTCTFPANTWSCSDTRIVSAYLRTSSKSNLWLPRSNLFQKQERGMNQKSSNRRSAAEWHNLIGQQQESGVSQKAFCELNDICLPRSPSGSASYLNPTLHHPASSQSLPLSGLSFQPTLIVPFRNSQSGIWSWNYRVASSSAWDADHVFSRITGTGLVV